MNAYYVAGFPYSDELYHYGVLGMKWGIRRYQNPSGTLTSLGKAHYSALKTAASIGRGIKKAGRVAGTIASRGTRRAVLNFKSKHKWLMSDAELKEYTNRLVLENAYKRAIEESRKKIETRGRRFANDVLGMAGNKLASAVFDNAADSIRQNHKKKLENKAIDENKYKSRASRKVAKDVLSKNRWKTMSDEELKNATQRYNSIRILERGLYGENDKKNK